MLWRIHYDDGSTFSDEDGVPDETRAYGVLAIAQSDTQVGRVIIHDKEFYVYRQDFGYWVGSDRRGIFDALLRRVPIVVCEGRTVSDKDFRIAWAKATDDPDFPRQSGLREVVDL